MFVCVCVCVCALTCQHARACIVTMCAPLFSNKPSTDLLTLGYTCAKPYVCLTGELADVCQIPHAFWCQEWL